MILTDKRILEEMEKGTIKVEPYNRADLGSNSYDVHLGSTMALYVDEVLDAKKHNTIEMMSDTIWLSVSEEANKPMLA